MSRCEFARRHRNALMMAVAVTTIVIFLDKEVTDVEKSNLSCEKEVQKKVKLKRIK